MISLIRLPHLSFGNIIFYILSIFHVLCTVLRRLPLLSFAWRLFCLSVPGFFSRRLPEHNPPLKVSQYWQIPNNECHLIFQLDLVLLTIYAGYGEGGVFAHIWRTACHCQEMKLPVIMVTLCLLMLVKKWQALVNLLYNSVKHFLYWRRTNKGNRQIYE